MKSAALLAPVLVTLAMGCDNPTGPIGRTVSTVAVGPGYSCALASGQLFCWGLGSPIPDVVDTTRTYGLVTVGYGFACALDASGAAFCWGQNIEGQLGDSSRTDRAAPTPVAGGHLFTRLTAAQYHTCGLDTDGVAWCWGANGGGQLGTGTTTESTVPVAVHTGGLRYAALSAGGWMTCALSAGGYADCWGVSSSGALGYSATDTCYSTAPCSLVPQRVEGGGKYREISVGESHVCAVALSGGIQCWGNNNYGQLGVDTTLTACIDFTCFSEVPVWVSGGGRYTSVAAGNSRTCAVAESGDAWCWGANVAVGYPQHEWLYMTPQLVQTSARFKELVQGWHICGLSSADEVLCWGQNSSGELGDGTFAQRPRPVRALLP